MECLSVCSPDEGDKQRDKFVKRFTPHIYNISPTALYESLQIVMGPRTFNHPYSTSQCVTDANNCQTNSVKIREMDSPPPTHSPQQPSQKAPNSTTFTSTMSALKMSTPIQETVAQTVSMEQPHITQPQQMSVTSTQMPINSLISNLSGANVQSIQAVQSTPVVQIQTLPIIPLNSTQIVTQQTTQQSINGFNDTSNISRSNSFSGTTSVINLIGGTPLSLSYVDSNTISNNNNINKSPEVIQMSSHNNLISGNFGNSVNMVSKPSNDLTHLLGATVLTFDANNRPVISVYSPHFAIKENSNNNHNNKDINSNNNTNITEKQNNLINTNLLLDPKVNSSVDTSDVSPSMDTSFYSPNNQQIERQSTETNGEHWSTNAIPMNCDEVTNHSTNSSLDFSFPSNDSQCM